MVNHIVGIGNLSQGFAFVSLLPTRVTAQDVCPEALCVSGDAERICQDFRVLGDGLDDVPALLFCRGDE
jgi:hypothetical protein